MFNINFLTFQKLQTIKHQLVTRKFHPINFKQQQQSVTNNL